MSFFRKRELGARRLLDGITLRSVSGKKTMMTFFDFEPDAVVPSHRHDHEQITYIVEGEMEFSIEGEKRILGKGDGVVILSGQEHGARVLSKRTMAVDAWYPIREDYE